MASVGPSSLLAQQQALIQRRRTHALPAPVRQRRALVVRAYAPLRESAPESALVTAVSVVEKQEELLLPLPRLIESAVDDPSLANPLLRATRLSTSWFGVVLEWEGVIVQSSEQEHLQAWLQVATEMGLSRPLGQQQRRIKGVRDEVIVSRIFGWTHNPVQARKIAGRKNEVLGELLGGRQPVAMLEAKPFLELCKRNNVPIALAAPLPEAKVEEALARLSLRPYFDAVVTADDAGTAEMEFYFALAAQKLGRPPLRCVVVGDSNSSVEASHELGMKSIIVSGNQPVYDFGSSDLVVRNLTQLSFMNLRKLFGEEQLVQPRNPLDEDGNPVARNSSSNSDDDMGGVASGSSMLDDVEDDPFGLFGDEDEDDFEDGPGGFGSASTSRGVPFGGVLGSGQGLAFQ